MKQIIRILLCLPDPEVTYLQELTEELNKAIEELKSHA
jgi:hypothetical protein